MSAEIESFNNNLIITTEKYMSIIPIEEIKTVSLVNNPANIWIIQKDGNKDYMESTYVGENTFNDINAIVKKYHKEKKSDRTMI